MLFKLSTYKCCKHRQLLAVSPLAVRGQFLRYIAFLYEFLHRVGGGRLSGAVVLEAAWVLLVQRLLPPDVQTQSQHSFNGCQRPLGTGEHSVTCNYPVGLLHVMAILFTLQVNSSMLFHHKDTA